MILILESLAHRFCRFINDAKFQNPFTEWDEYVRIESLNFEQIS